MARPRPRRIRHPRIHRLVQPPKTPRTHRKHPTRRKGGQPLQSTNTNNHRNTHTKHSPINTGRFMGGVGIGIVIFPSPGRVQGSHREGRCSGCDGCRSGMVGGVILFWKGSIVRRLGLGRTGGILTLFVLMVVLMFGAGTVGGQVVASKGSAGFGDVLAGRGADEEVGWAVANGVSVGGGVGRFGTNGVVTGGRFVSLLDRTGLTRSL